MTAKIIVLAITLFIYVLIIFAFNKARAKYKGGRGGEVISLILLILVTVGLLFLADYVGLLDPYRTDTISFTPQTLFRTTALSFLARKNVSRLPFSDITPRPSLLLADNYLYHRVHIAVGSDEFPIIKPFF